MIRVVLNCVLKCFFEKKYLKGAYFDSKRAGYYFAFKAIWKRNILRLGRTYPFPVSGDITISNPKNLTFHPDDLNNFQSFGIYFQNISGHIYLGKGTYIAPNVGLITSNHDLSDLSRHSEGRDIVIGKECWIGMNSVILPGVVLGDNTIVAAGAVVTKSFDGGVVAGVPAKVIREF